MKRLITLLLTLTIAKSLFSQSDNCATATVVNLSGGTACVNGTTTGATSDNILYGACNVASVNEVWYTYVASGAQNDFTITSLGLTNAEIIIDVDGCGNGTFETCNTVTGGVTLNQSWGIAPGQQVWIGIASNQGVQGNFQLCINSYTASTGGGNACGGAIPICSTAPVTFNSMASFTASGQYPSCFLSAPQQDVFLQFTILTNGTFEWTASQLCAAEFDWALWNITSGCPGTIARCNYNYAGQNSGTFGMTGAIGGPACTGENCDPINVTAGQIYVLQIDNYSTANDCGFTFTYSGTAQITPTTSFSINPNTFTCGSSVNVTINNTSIGIPTWEFGNGNSYTGTTPPSQTYTAPGTYAITATILGQCPATSAQYVQLYGPLAGTIVSTPASCPNSTNGTASVNSVSGGDGNYTYLWNTGATTSTITGLAPGNYSVTISNSACGSSILLNTTVFAANPLPTVTSVSGGGTYCSGVSPGNISVSTTGTGPWTLNYTINGSPQSVNFASSPSSLGNAAGIYVVTGITDAYCSNSASGSQSITVNPLPIISLTPSDPSACNGTDGSILISGSGSGTIFWSGAASSNGAGSLNYTIPNLSAGAYSVYFVDGTTGCQSATANTLLYNPNAPILNNPGPATVCDTYTLPAISGTNLTLSASYWTGANGTGAQLSAGNSITNTQTIYLYDINGSCYDEESFVVTVNNTPSITNPGAQTACDSYTLGAIAGTNLSGIQAFYNNSQAMGGSVIAGPITSTQTVWIYDAEGSCSDEESFEITISNTPIILNPGPSIVCDSYILPSILGTNLSPSLSYWTQPGGTGSQLLAGDPVLSSQTIYIYDINGVCSDEESFNVTVNYTPTLNNPGDQTECASYTLPMITGSSLSGSESYWTSSGGTGIQLNVGGALSSTQTVYIYDADGSCSDEVSFVTTINPLPTVTSTSGTNTYCIGDASQNIEVNVTGSASWTIDYTLDGVAMSATGNASPVVLGNAAGEYILTGITDANCTNSAVGTAIITFVGCDFTIPTAITPNADGVHDDWELYGLDAAYPNNVVRIFNRWGGLLYEHDSSVDGPYDSNRWKGDYNGEALPVGSYYYIIELNDEDKKVESGAVSILLEK